MPTHGSLLVDVVTHSGQISRTDLDAISMIYSLGRTSHSSPDPAKQCMPAVKTLKTQESAHVIIRESRAATTPGAIETLYIPLCIGTLTAFHWQRPGLGTRSSHNVRGSAINTQHTQARVSLLIELSETSLSTAFHHVLQYCIGRHILVYVSACAGNVWRSCAMRTQRGT